MLDAATALAWVRNEVEPLAVDLQPALPAADASLCDFLRDGRALCLLTTALPSTNSSDNQQPQDDDTPALPKNLQRSLHQTTTFHALERVQYFLKWCSASAALDAHVVFSSVQLLDEQNDTVVCACLDALHTKYRPHLNSLKLKSAGLWVQRSASNVFAAASDNQQTHDADATTSSSGVDTHVTTTVEAAPTPAPAPANRLNAFLSKFPSETNVLAPVAVAAVASTTDVAAVDEQIDSDMDDNNDDDDEPVRAYDDDVDVDHEDDDNADLQQPRSSFGSSVSFSFTSDPRHHESFTDDPQPPSMDLSFSSVLSTPPASPKAAATRLRIPSIFERNTESVSGSSAAPTVALNRASAATREELAPRRLQIPSAFASGGASSAPSAVATSPAVETPAAASATTAVDATPEPAAAVTPKPVSKLSIPAAFARSSSTSSSSTSSDRTSGSSKAIESPTVLTPTVETTATPDVSAVPSEPTAETPKPVSKKLSIPAAFARSSSTSSSSTSSERMSGSAKAIESPTVLTPTVETTATPDVSAVPSEPTAETPKPVSKKLSIPAAFARSASTSSSSTSSERLSLEKSDGAAAPPASPLASGLTRKPSRLKIPSVFAAGALASVADAPVAPTRVVTSDVETTFAAATAAVDAAVETASAAVETDPILEVVRVDTVAEAPTTPTAAAVPQRATPRSPFAAFVGATSTLTATAPPSVTRSMSESSTASAAATMPPAMTRSTSNSGSGATPASKLAAFLSTVEVVNAFTMPSTESVESDSADTPAVTRESLSDDDVSDDDDTSLAQVSEAIAFDDDAVHVEGVQEPAIGLPTADAVAHADEAAANSDADDDDVDAHFDEQLSDDDEPSDLDTSVSATHVDAKAEAETDRSSLDFEHHSIAHHDHADSEQPFFVVEEVSLAKPATSSKLYAFLNAVDSAQTHRFSHTSTGDDDATAAEPSSTATAAVDDDDARCSNGSVHSTLSASSSHKLPGDETTTSEHSPRHSTASVSVDAAVVIENERLTDENVALQRKLERVEAAVAAKDDAFATLQAELETLKMQFAAAQDAATAAAAAANSDAETRLAAASAVHRNELAAAEQTRVALAQQKTLVDAQVERLTGECTAHVMTIAALEQQNEALTHELQRAQDSEAAARYAAQVAFAARDDAEERIRTQQEQHAQCDA